MITSRHRWAWPAGVVLFAVTLLTSVAIDPLPSSPWRDRLPMSGSSAHRVHAALFQDNRKGVLRPLVVALWFGVSFLLAQRYEKPLARMAGRVLIPVG